MGAKKVKKSEEKEKKEGEVKPEKKPKTQVKEIIGEIVRVSGTDLDGRKPLIRAIRQIKGISYNMSKAVCFVSGIEPNRKLSTLKEDEIKKIEEIIKDPLKFGIPYHLLNRRKDLETGKDMHLTGPDLDVSRKFDIQRYVDLKSYKGLRHMYGLPVRGQRTKSSFRKGRTMGVIRKAAKIVQEKAATEEKK